MNRGRVGGVHEDMNRPDIYMKQLAGLDAWLAAQGDEEGAALARELAERIHDRHEGIDDQTTLEWANGPDDECDIEPEIRCSPAVGIVFENNAGEPILTIDMLDGGDVAVVHMGDVVRWVERRGAPAADRPTLNSGEIHDERANRIPETPQEARERAAYEATVGDVIDAEFEDDADDGAGDENAGPYSAMHADEQIGDEGPDDIDLTGDADTGAEDDEP